jgi:hypothetical protein
VEGGWGVRGGDCGGRVESSRRGMRRAGGSRLSRLAGGRGWEAGAVYSSLLIVSRDDAHIIPGGPTVH